MEGYLHPLYARSLSEFGETLFLSNSKGWIIKRQIPGTSYYDAMGPYPLFFCEDWAFLHDDFRCLQEELVSIVMVIDPFVFPFAKNHFADFDIFEPYKDHYLLDLSLPFEKSISRTKVKISKKALKKLDVDYKKSPNISLDEWSNLYDCLIDRHNIKDIRTFSHKSFSDQILIPNTYFFRALHKGQVVGGNLVFVQGDVAYFHLSAFNEKGYELGASYAIKWRAIHFLADKVKWINFGGGTGKSTGELSGLDLFKMSWSNKTAKSYLCGKILNSDLYKKISLLKNKTDSEWFPTYREGEYI